ncbi:MAG TPA: hypothetical protein VG963_25415, partial [Polyangiaceae bacterium]|nr:hypothetical protein [Polyangiaceae bacterium]
MAIAAMDSDAGRGSVTDVGGGNAGGTGAVSAAAPAATVEVDLTSETGAAIVGATWRYSDAHLKEVQFRAPDGAGQPTGAPLSTYEISPQAGVAG